MATVAVSCLKTLSGRLHAGSSECQAGRTPRSTTWRGWPACRSPPSPAPSTRPSGRGPSSATGSRWHCRPSVRGVRWRPREGRPSGDVRTECRCDDRAERAATPDREPGEGCHTTATLAAASVKVNPNGNEEFQRCLESAFIAVSAHMITESAGMHNSRDRSIFGRKIRHPNGCDITERCARATMRISGHPATSATTSIRSVSPVASPAAVISACACPR